MTSKPRGRPIAPPRESLAQTIEALRKGLDRQPAVVPVWVGRAALHHLEKAQAAEQELYRLRDIEASYASLVTEQNEIWNEARARNIEVFQAFGEDVWTWINGSQRGTAATPSAALIAALDD